MADPNMDIVYSWAEQLGPPPAIPSSIKEPRKIAEFVDFVDKNIFANSEFWKFSVTERQKFLQIWRKGLKITLATLKMAVKGQTSL